MEVPLASLLLTAVIRFGPATMIVALTHCYPRRAAEGGNPAAR